MNPQENGDLTFRSGYVAIVGRPNVGKSTLMNRILGEKLAIVTHKPQTTRNRILGVKTSENAQILFLDTPGVHAGKTRLNDMMVKAALSALEDADLILFLVEPRLGLNQDEKILLDKLNEVNTPIYLIINKIDTSSKSRLLPLIDRFRQLARFREIVPVSGLTGDGVEMLETMIRDALPEGPPFFPEDVLTDVSQRFMIGEMIREKIILKTGKEIPHAVAVVVEAVRRREGRNLTDVSAVIYVERDSQKGILIGDKGRVLKEIGSRVRPEIEEFLGTRVFLELWVKVKRDWRSQLRMLREFGFE
ncbi:MAG: GTPase Era [bacterium]|nr:GTPase Era [bacterium]